MCFSSFLGPPVLSPSFLSLYPLSCLSHSDSQNGCHIIEHETQFPGRGKADRRTDRQTDRQILRQTDTQTGREVDVVLAVAATVTATAAVAGSNRNSNSSSGSGSPCSLPRQQ